MKTKAVIILLGMILSLNVQAQNWDINLLNKLNSPPNPEADKTWQFITNTATPLNIAAPITMFLVGYASHNEDLKMKSYESIAAAILNAGVTTAIKLTVKRERPFNAYPGLLYKKTDGGSYSFPSGHTSAAFNTATSLSLAFPKWYVIAPAYAYASAVAYSRMYLGVHYPSDEIGGILIGAGSSLVCFQAHKLFEKVLHPQK